MAIPAGFSKGLALFLANCCLQAYNQFNFKEVFSIPDNYTLLSSIIAAPAKTLNSYGYIMESEQSIVIAFRGSISNPDWIADAAILQTDFPYTRTRLKIHSGFAAIYTACRQQIISVLRNSSSSKQLFVTGHSLGGALAVLCALDAAVNTVHRNPTMYNFGSPRIGSPQFVQTYNEIVGNSMRIVNTNDIVALLPPIMIHPPLSNLLLYYKHVKNLVKVTFQTGSIAGNHTIENYINALRAIN